MATPDTPGAGTRPGAPQVRISFPGDWVCLDGDMIRRWKERAGEVRPELRGALGLLERASEVFADERALTAAFLLERGSTTALATLACFHVALPMLPDGFDLAAQVRATPPHDAVEGTFEVDADEAAGGKLRSRCLRRVVLELPSRDTVSLAVEYFVPVRADGGMLVASFTTPNVAKEDEYLDLFSRIASTIVITG